MTVEERVQAEQLRLLYRHAPLSAVINLLAALLLLSYVYDGVARSGAIVWLAIFVAAWIPRTAVYVLHARKPDLCSPRMWYALFLAGLFLAGCTWGLSARYLYSASTVDQMVLAITLLGLTAGATLSLSSIRSLSALYIFPSFMPMAIRFALGHARVPAELIGLAAVYCAGMTLGANLNNRFLVSALRLRFQNAELAERLEALATRDTLTGLPNRFMLADHLASAIARAKRTRRLLAVVFLDCDGFKTINDTYGHAAGDAYLKHIAEQLQTAVRESDMVARFGGDEFVVVLEDCGSAEALENIVKRIRWRALSPMRIGADTITPHLSLGVAMCPPDEIDGEQLIQWADEAMYRAKRAGGDAIAYRGT